MSLNHFTRKNNVFKTLVNISHRHHHHHHHRCSSSLVGGTFTKEGNDARMKGTLSYQNTLPKQPIPSLEQTMSNYLERSLPYLTADEKVATKSSVISFLHGDGPKLHQQLLDYNESKENYIEDFYQELYSNADFSSHSLNPNFVLFKQPGDDSAPKTSTRLVQSILAHFVACKEGTFPATVNKGKAIDMRQLPWIHASARIPQQGKPDELVCHIDKPEQHLVVLMRGHVYKVDLFKQVGDEYFMIEPEALEEELRKVEEDASSREAGLAVGSLTCGVRPVWEDARQRLAANGNAETLATIDEALLVLCFDDGEACQNLSGEGMELNVMYGVDEMSCSNRWMDKWNIIVTKDGQAGMNWEHSLLDGHTMMEFFSPVGANQMNYGTDLAKCKPLANNTDKVSPLEWHNVDEGIIQSIEKTTKESYDKSTSVGVETLEFRDYGGKLIKSSKCSPDGFAQAAMFIAFYGMTNALPVPYESVLAKAFKHGRVTVARNMSQSIADNLSSFNQLPQSEQEACFRAMVAEIGRICREAASGNEMDRPILAYRTLANMANAQSKAEGGKDVVVSIPFLQDESWAKLGALDLCTSHCGKPPIRFFGYEPASANGYSVGYYVDNEFMQFSINHFDKKAAKDFKHALDKTLKMLPSIFNDSTTK